MPSGEKDSQRGQLQITLPIVIDNSVQHLFYCSSSRTASKIFGIAHEQLKNVIYHHNKQRWLHHLRRPPHSVRLTLIQHLPRRLPRLHRRISNPTTSYNPIEQQILGRSSLYRTQNIERRKWMSVREWADMCAKTKLRTPGVDDVALKVAEERRAL